MIMAQKCEVGNAYGRLGAYLFSADITTMRDFYICLVYCSVVKSRINFRVPKKLLNLFDWHSFFQSHSCHCASEFVWMHMINVRFLSKNSQKFFYTGDGETVPWGLKTDKKCGIGILSCI